ncbi:MAG TPA: hypothetical protein VIG54_01045, partial [Lysobacter sp.]
MPDRRAPRAIALIVAAVALAAVAVVALPAAALGLLLAQPLAALGLALLRGDVAQLSRRHALALL